MEIKYGKLVNHQKKGLKIYKAEILYRIQFRKEHNIILRCIIRQEPETRQVGTKILVNERNQ